MSDPINGDYAPSKEAMMNAVATVMIWDGFAFEDWTWTHYSARIPDGGAYGLSARHNDGLNVGFYDGHAKWWKFDNCWVTNAGAAIPDCTQPGNRATVGPNPFWTGNGES